jgi:periplasmic divalent cation tolerance protein
MQSLGLQLTGLKIETGWSSTGGNQNMAPQPVIVLITAPSKEVGREIANLLLEQKLAACVNILSPINSLYIWEGKINDDEEALLVVKTRADLLKDGLIPAVKAVHPYEVPEIIALPVFMGLESYLEWIEEVTDQGRRGGGE